MRKSFLAGSGAFGKGGVQDMLRGRRDCTERDTVDGETLGETSNTKAKVESQTRDCSGV